MICVWYPVYAFIMWTSALHVPIKIVVFGDDLGGKTCKVCGVIYLKLYLVSGGAIR